MGMNTLELETVQCIQGHAVYRQLECWDEIKDKK